jgi:F-type H+-transporting ATPase subunit gamma
LLDHLSSVADASTNPLLNVTDEKNKLVVIITADRGMCGAFNSNVIKYACNYIDEIGKDTKIIIIGKKASDFFARRDYNIIEKYTSVFGDLNIGVSNSIVAKIVTGYLNNEYNSVELIYNEFKSVVRQNVLKEKFLPIVSAAEKAVEKYSKVDYIYEPSAESILNDLIPRKLNIQLWKALLESNAAEQGARMTSMEIATKNAEDMIKFLDLLYNKARQESITKEILEIVSGAEALKEG